ncbi:MAG: hypothetical protein WDN00_08495 [Limisphaerales bacterium]
MSACAAVPFWHERFSIHFAAAVRTLSRLSRFSSRSFGRISKRIDHGCAGCFFQADPFARFKGGLLVFEEDGELPLGEEKICNAKWVKALFGPEALAQIGHFPILCSGTVMGDIPAMLRYLNEFESLLSHAQSMTLVVRIRDCTIICAGSL